MKKQKINGYYLITEKDNKINKQVFTDLEKLWKNVRILLMCGETCQISKMEIEVDLSCLNVWNKC